MIQNEMKWSDRKDTNGTKVNVKVNAKNLLYCLVRRIFTKGMLGICYRLMYWAISALIALILCFLFALLT